MDTWKSYLLTKITYRYAQFQIFTLPSSLHSQDTSSFTPFSDKKKEYRKPSEHQFAARHDWLSEVGQVMCLFAARPPGLRAPTAKNDEWHWKSTVAVQIWWKKRSISRDTRCSRDHSDRNLLGMRWLGAENEEVRFRSFDTSVKHFFSGSF